MESEQPKASLCAEVPAADNRLAELKAFDDTKAGVKGLIEAGVRSVPRIFIHPLEDRAEPFHHPQADPAASQQIPVVDLSAAAEGGSSRRVVVEQIRRASLSWGFFQIVGHGVPGRVLDEMVAGVRRFHEGGAEEKAAFYSRDFTRKVRFISNHNLFEVPAADWRDTLFCNIAPDPPHPVELPAACGDIIMEYSAHAASVAETLLELLSESLGLRPSHLKGMECDKGLYMACHYYPPCPEPELTMAISRHCDANFLSLVLQDNVGGLQVLREGKWVDVPPVAGALVVNLGDLMQLVTNDRYESVEHRVVANRDRARVSVGCFFIPEIRQSSPVTYAPIEELLSEDDPPKYRGALYGEYMHHYSTAAQSKVPALSHFKL